ncbi:MAG TPA: hypothetical protein VF053_18840 [Streptosporangiales bacterium]
MATGEDLGRGPEWGDDGLPEIDVEIPDDIRELDRDVQAYHRELRRQRRHDLLRRTIPGMGRLGPYGVLAPVVAAALIVTAVLGSVMSLLGPRPPTAVRGAGTPRDSSVAGDRPGVGRTLPDAPVTVDGIHTTLSSVRSAIVVTLPVDCRCAGNVDSLVSTARSVGVAVYLSGPHADTDAAAAREGRYPRVLDGAQQAIADRYRPSGLSAVLVGKDGKVTDVLRDLGEQKPVPDGRLATLAPTSGS